MVALFWLLLIASVYSYFLYPIILKLLRQKADRFDRSQSQTPLRYSLIVTVFNEKSRVREKLDNLLSLEFDKSRVELIVASDCSDDGTDDIVREYAAEGIKLVRAEERLGKENAQLTAINSADGDILVFSDVATRMDANAIEILDRYFQRPELGAVSSEDRFVSQDGAIAGEGAYVKYEMWLRQQESRLGGLIGLSGSFFAARKSICSDWDIHSPSDFNTALNCAKAGMLSVSAPDLIGYYKDLKDSSKEYSRKVRTALRGMTGLSRHMEVLNFRSMGVFAFQVFSHKLMRWGVPWFLILLLLVSVLVSGHGLIYQGLLIGQILFYLTALFAHLNESLRRNSLVKLVYFFVQVNIALLDAAMKFFRGTRMTTWKPSAR